MLRKSDVSPYGGVCALSGGIGSVEAIHDPRILAVDENRRRQCCSLGIVLDDGGMEAGMLKIEF